MTQQPAALATGDCLVPLALISVSSPLARLSGNDRQAGNARCPGWSKPDGARPENVIHYKDFQT
jgi:hypothetical protein